MTIRTRMAPSPTGKYHIGHIRTVLYNYAFTRNNNGKFLIRIEDTDKKRFVEGAVEEILDVIEEFGLTWDEGPRKGGDLGPYVQSERLDLYKKYAEELVQKEVAYHCFCSTDRLKELREKQQKQGLPVTKYDKKCLKMSKEETEKRLAKGDENVIRLNVLAGRDITFEDLVYGSVTINSDALDDQILLKSDGYPSYHLGVVVDDHLMEITHVMRGNDWISSTPKHVLLYEGLGWELPTFIHLPNLKEQGTNKKLSKRFGPVEAATFLKEGYLPEAMLNFLMFLGWNPGTEKEIYSLDEFVADFDVKRIHKTDLVSFDRAKLLWYNGQYIRGMSLDKLYEKIKFWSEENQVKLPSEFLKGDGKDILALVQERLKKFDEITELISYFYEEPKVDKELLIKFAKDDMRAKEILDSFAHLFSAQKDWGGDKLEDVAHKMLDEGGYKSKEAFMTLRVAISGVTATPPIFDTLVGLGKETVLKRVERASNMIDSR